MKRNLFASAIAVFVAAFMLSSCGTMGSSMATGTSAAPTTNNNNTGTLGNVLGSVLGGLIGNAVPVTAESLVGTWAYESPEVRFESESFLSQAGGEIAAASIEQKLAEVYAMVSVIPGTSGFIFNQDKTCTIAIGANGINGTYTVDTKSNTINIVSSTGLIKISGKVYFGLNQLVILFDANKILTMAQTLGTLTGKGSSTVGSLAGALGSYKGLLLGMNLNKL